MRKYRMMKMFVGALAITVALGVGTVPLMQAVSAAVSSGTASSKSLQVTEAPLRLMFDGYEIAPPAGEEGFLYQNTTYVPLRFMANALEKDVRWDGETSTVSVTEPSKERLISIREQNMNNIVRLAPSGKSDKVQWKTLKMFVKPIIYVFDGVKKAPAEGQTGLIYNNKTYIPLRFFSTSVGRNIDWDPKTFTISIKKGTSGEAPNSSTGGSEQTNDLQPGNEGTSNTPPITGGGGVGSGAVKPTYDSLISSADQSIMSLKDRCQKALSPLADQFFAAHALEEQLAIYAQGQTKLTECDSSFNNLLNKLKNELKKYNYSTAVIDQYRKEYEAMKDAEINKLLDRMK